jgi:hypothetical protein
VGALIADRERQTRRSLLAALTGVTLLLGACGDSARQDGGGETAWPTVPGELQVDLRFRPDPNGYSFTNFSPASPFDPYDAIALLGEEIVCETLGGSCTVRPLVEAWIEMVASAARGGVCEGMAVTALARFIDGSPPPTASLDLDAEAESQIRQAFATQFLPEIRGASASLGVVDLAGILDHIGRGLAPDGDPLTIGIYSAAGGHTLVPFGLERLDSERAVVWVADPNHPNDIRRLEFHLGKAIWRYQFADGPTPGDTEEDPGWWQGSVADIDLTPLSARRQTFADPTSSIDQPARTMLTLTSASTAWSIDLNGMRIDSQNVATPEVVFLSRGAFGVTTVVVAVPDEAPVGISTMGDTSVTISGPGRSIGLRTRDFGSAAGAEGVLDLRIQTDPTRTLVEVNSGDLETTVSTIDQRWTLDAVAGTSVSADAGGLEVSGASARVRPPTTLEPVEGGADTTSGTTQITLPPQGDLELTIDGKSEGSLEATLTVPVIVFGAQDAVAGQLVVDDQLGDYLIGETGSFLIGIYTPLRDQIGQTLRFYVNLLDVNGRTIGRTPTVTFTVVER